MPIFMKAGSIEGDVVAESHRHWVQVESCKYEVSFDEDDVRKSVQDGAPEPNLDEPFEVQKSKTDRSGPALMQWMVDGDELESVQFDVCGDTIFGGHWRCHTRYLLKHVVLKDYGIKMNDGEKGSVSITLKLKYKEISVEHISYGKGNAERVRSKAAAHQRAE